jgi:hypothetical protein
VRVFDGLCGKLLFDFFAYDKDVGAAGVTSR